MQKELFLSQSILVVMRLPLAGTISLTESKDALDTEVGSQTF